MEMTSRDTNCGLLKTNHGVEILYSYKTPVAGYLPVIGHFVVNEYYSCVTSRHINDYLQDAERVKEISSEDIERAIIGELL